MQPTAFFLPARSNGSVQGDQRFCLYHAPQAAALGVVLYIHPFAEEMNKSRRMAALQARALAEAGFAVMQIDLQGCGDSSGDFGDASWNGWLDDIGLACDWLRQQSPGPLWLWGLRAGCLLAVDAARRMQPPVHLLFWAPPVSGKQLLQQFLRLKLAGDMLDGGAKGGMDGLRQQLAAGQAVEVAGYSLAPALCAGLEAATLAPAVASSGPPPQLVWLELSNREPPSMTPAAAKALAQWQEAGVAVHSAALPGPAFWQTSEIEVAPDLLQATTSAMLEAALHQKSAAA